MNTCPRHLRVFISSPGDVSDERAIARSVIDLLQYDPLLSGRITCQAISWDDPRAQSPMLANLTPQQAVDRDLPLPSQCDITVLILWTRIGTPMSSTHLKPDGSTYLSGTEWEFEDARRGPGDVLVYRRTTRFEIDADDIEAEQKLTQKRLVNEFFARFRASDGTLCGGFSEYDTPEELRKHLDNDLRKLIRLELDETQIAAPVKRAWSGSPFPGLRAFGLAESAIFFGRGRETDDLVHRLRDPQCRFLAVIGASGSGKSSLVAAGLLPRLKDNAVPGSKDWLSLRFTPGGAGGDPVPPLAKAAAALGAIPEREQQIVDMLTASSEAVSELVRQLLADRPRWSELVLFVDQLEELFTVVSEHKRAQFIQLLARTAKEPRCRIVVTLRADFLAQFTQSPELTQPFQNGAYLLASLGPGALYEIITRPAERAGIRLQEGLADAIVAEAGASAGALPLIAYALSELYKICGPDAELSLDAYRALGGIAGAVAQRAEAVFSELDTAAQASLPQVFRALISVDDQGVATRMRAARASLARNADAARLLSALTEARLLVSDVVSDTAFLEIAHESVFKAWTRLEAWIREDREYLQWHKRLVAARDEWQRSGNDPDALLRGVKLVQAEHWLADKRSDLSEPERQFIEASLELQESELRAAHRQVQLHQSRQLAAQASALLDRGFDLALLLAIEAHGAADTFEAHSALFGALLHNPHLSTFLRGITAPPEPGAKYPRDCSLAFHPSGRWLCSVGGLSATYAIVWDLDRRAPVGAPIELNEVVLSVAFSNDGETLALATERGTIAVYAFHTRERINSFCEPNSPGITTLRFLEGNNLLAGYMEYCIWDYVQGRVVEQFTDLLARNHRWKALRSSGNESKSASLLRPVSGEDGAEHFVDGSACALAPDAPIVALADYARGTLTLWDLSARKPLAQLRAAQLGPVALHDNGRVAFIDGADLVLAAPPYDAPQRMRNAHRDEVEIVTFSADGERLATSAFDDGIILWSVSPRPPLFRVFAKRSGEPNVGFGLKGRVLVVNDGSTLSCLDVATAGVIREWPFSDGGHRSLAFSSDGRFVAVRAAGDHATVVDLETNRLCDIACDPDVIALEFVPQSHKLAIGARDGLLKFWDVASDRPAGEWRGSIGSPIEALAYSPQASSIALIHADGSLELRDANSGALIGEVMSGPELELGSTGMLFDPDGSLLFIAASEIVHVYDLEARRLLRRFGPAYSLGAPMRLAQSRGDNLLAYGRDMLHPITVMDCKGRQVLGPALEYDGKSGLTGLAFAPDTRVLAAGFDNGAIVFWDMSAATWRARASEIANRTLTDDERALYLGDEPPARASSRSGS